MYFLPERFELDGQVQTELRSRGIYEARLFHADNRISGHFSIPAQLGIKEDFADYQFDQPFLAVGISDIRGIENALKLELNGQNLDFVPGSQVGWLGEGAHVTLPALDAKQSHGTGLRFRPAPARHWPVADPSGRQDQQSTAGAPTGRTRASSATTCRPSVKSGTGFTANWQTSFFSTNLEEALTNCLTSDRL